MKKIRENAAGIDIGAMKVFVSIEDQEVKNFFTFTEDLEQLRDYLLKHKIKTVAMEATGVYWNILYEILDEAGIDVWLVDGRQTKQVPGRKTDVKDCQWIQQLHSYGLLNRCFVVESDIKELRSYQRLREDHIRSAAMHVNHMQKALTEMNIRLKEVLSQIHGTSGLERLKSLGVTIIVNAQVKQIVKDHYNKIVIETNSPDNYQFDEVISTLPSDISVQIAPSLSKEEIDKHKAIKYLGVICPSVLLKRPISEYYVTNITDTWTPFTGIIEMTALVDPKELGNRSLVYLPKYIELRMSCLADQKRN